MFDYKSNINLETANDIYNGKASDGSIISFDISNTGKKTLRAFKDAVSNIENKTKNDQRNIYAVDDFSSITDISHMWNLYDYGMRILSPTGSGAGTYGSGEETRCGLTYRGSILVKSAVSLGVALNISKTNKETIRDIIDQYLDLERRPFLITDSNKSFELLNYLGTYDTFLICNIDNTEEYEKFINLVKHGYPLDRIILTGGKFFEKKNIFGKEIPIEKRIDRVLRKKFPCNEIDNLIEYNFKWLYDILYCDENKEKEEKHI